MAHLYYSRIIKQLTFGVGYTQDTLERFRGSISSLANGNFYYIYRADSTKMEGAICNVFPLWLDWFPHISLLIIFLISEKLFKKGVHPDFSPALKFIISGV